MNNMITMLIAIICFGAKGLYGHYGRHSQLLDSLSMSKDEAFSFLRIKRSSDCVTNEPYCEANKATCMLEFENSREHFCSTSSNTCSASQTCFLSVPCPAHFELGCTDEPCMSLPCFNGGTCSNNGTSSYQCSCTPGYESSTDCQSETDECASNPCQNGGQCHDQLNSYSCTCQPGYTGVNCETGKALRQSWTDDICASNPCQNAGQCHDHVNSYSCTCQPGYTGVNCETEIDECASNPCQYAGQCHDHVNSYSCTCQPGYSSVNCGTEIDECASNPCQNAGQCHDYVNSYNCTCQPGYSSMNCETDINECASQPCQNGGQCNDLINYYTCECVPRYNGTVCEKDCRPGPADILFVLDFSGSADVNKTLDYVRSFISQIPIGPSDFQIGLITYSFEAILEFNLSAHINNDSLLEGINNVQGAPKGPTYTGQALQLARQVMTNTSYGARDITVRKYIVLLTDGMSTDRSVAYQEATILKYSSITVMAVGVGTYIDHKELYRLAGESKYMFPYSETGPLNTILIETSDADCIDCTENDKVDIVFVVDVSATQILQQYITRIKQIVSLLQTDSRDINYGVVSYSSSPSIEFELGSYSHDQVMTRLSRILPNQGIPYPIMALNFTRHNTFANSRAGAQKIAVFLSHVDRDWEDVDGVKAQIQLLEQDGIKVILIGEGDELDDKLSGVSTDSYSAIYTTSNSDDVDRLYGILTEARHIQCDPDVFYVRQ